jgi:NADH-quinone oxidoreductase subunit E
MNLQTVDKIIDSYDADRTSALAILQDAQMEYDYLPREAMERTAERLGIPLSEVHRLATFFCSFRLEEPPGEHTIRVCMGTACHMRGAQRILEQLEKELQIKAGEATPDGSWSLETVRCMGGCAQGFLVEVDGEPYSHVTPAEVGKLLDALRERGDQPRTGSAVP